MPDPRPTPTILPVRPRVSRIVLALAALLTALGGPLDALQWVAWSGMLWQRSANSGVEAAVASTFDGNHPCALCSAVAEAKEQRSPQEPLAPAELAKALTAPLALWQDPAPAWLGLLARPQAHDFAAPATPRGQWQAAPPGPPPRSC